MKVYEKEIFVPLKQDNKELLEYFSKYITENLPDNRFPVRFVITKTDDKGYYCEIGVLSETEDFNIPRENSIFDFKKRTYEKNEEFTGVLVIPTGIDAELGGHAGDAGALARLVAETCDTLIIHPNVVNASDINEMPENSLYVEGSTLSRLIMGTVGLQRVRANKLEVILDKHREEYFTESAVNSVSAARSTLGIDAEVIIPENKFKMESCYAESGRAVGTIENLKGLYDLLCSRRNKDAAIAISSVIEVAEDIRKKYYKDKVVNPWGGIEAMLTHTISLLFNVPCAHSPMTFSSQTEDIDLGIVDPRKAAEVVSTTYLHCILKGLHKSPKIITNTETINQPHIINASDINFLVIPDKCIGLQTLAALEQGIKIIAVKENKNLMQNNLTQLPWNPKQLTIVENYPEAIGAIYSIKSGTSIESVRRPLKPTQCI